jgi:hypothetical protein
VKESVKFFLLLQKNQILFLSLLAIALLVTLIVFLSVQPVYESRAVLRIGTTIQFGQPPIGRNTSILNDELSVIADSLHYLERVRNLQILLMQIHGGETPFFGAPPKPFLAEVYKLESWHEEMLIKIRAATPEEAVGFAADLLGPVLMEHNELVARNRESVTKLLTVAETEFAVIEAMPDSPDKSLARVLLEERIARHRQLLDELIRESMVVQEPADTVTRVRPRPIVYLISGLFASLLISVVGVVTFEWLRSVRSELYGMTSND